MTRIGQIVQNAMQVGHIYRYPPIADGSGHPWLQYMGCRTTVPDMLLFQQYVLPYDL